VYEPHFTFHGFRYVAVQGLPAPPDSTTITGIAVSSDLTQTGHLVTSDSLLNQLQRNIVWGQRSNFLDVPTDCPQRDERLGWTGDAQVFARTAAFNMDVNGFFAKWLSDVASDQDPSGSVPWVIPNPLGGDSIKFAGTAGWSDVAVIIPWTMYLMYGDRRLLEHQYPSMRAWVDYARRRTGPDLIWRPGWQFGLFGSPDPTWYRWPTQLAWRVAQQAARLSQHARAVGSLSPLELGRYIAGRVEGHKARRESQDAARFDPVLVRRGAVERATVAAVRRYRPGRFTGRVGLFLPSQEWLPSAARRWHSLAPRAEAYVGPAGCNNDTMLLDPYAAGFADLFRRCREGMAPIPPRKSDPRLPLPLLAVRRAD